VSRRIQEHSSYCSMLTGSFYIAGKLSVLAETAMKRLYVTF